MIFKSAVSKLNKYIYVGVIVFLLLLTIPAFFEDSIEPFLALFSIHFLVIVFLIWMYKSTFYKIENTILEVKKLVETTHNKQIDIDKEIPDSMYKAVAEIFSFIYDLSNNKNKLDERLKGTP